ncbi:MAG: hypothetical protein ACRDKZ_07295 [Actinomycetota bacterium]
MRTLSTGLLTLRRFPLAGMPMLLEGLVAALLIGSGVIPADGGSAAVAAAFPLDLFFDVKHWMAFTPDWPVFLVALTAAVVIRSAVLAGVLYFAQESHWGFLQAWRRAGGLALRAVVVFLPAAALYFTAVALRYAPFIWIAAVLALGPALSLARRAVSLDIGGGSLGIGRLPELKHLLVYGYVVSLLAAAMAVLARSSPWLAGLFVLLTSPLHAAFLLGWREHMRNGIHPRDGRLVFALTLAAVVGFFAVTVYDRNVRSPEPVGADHPGTLLLLGGAASTSDSGALTDIDPRALGFSRRNSELVSYRGEGQTYSAADTRLDLADSAVVVSEQIDAAREPRDLLGHSQAALILDRILEDDLTPPDSSAQIAAPPPTPPPIEVPVPDRRGAGKAGGDLARLISALFDGVGLAPLDLDSPATPTNLNAVVVRESEVPRLALWALGDSVWLDGDWRRPGEVNLVVLSDHVGATRNPRTFDSARAWFGGRSVASDEASWRGLLVNVFRYAFEPWRP